MTTLPKCGECAELLDRARLRRVVAVDPHQPRADRGAADQLAALRRRSSLSDRGSRRRQPAGADDRAGASHSRVACAPQRALGVAVDDVDRRRACRFSASRARRATCASTTAGSEAKRRSERVTQIAASRGTVVAQRSAALRSNVLRTAISNAIGSSWLAITVRTTCASDGVVRRTCNAHRLRRPGIGDELERRADDRGEAAERSGHQLRQVVAGDVLHDLAAGLRQHAVGRRQLDADHEIARRAVAVAQRTAVVGREQAADGRPIRERRIERQPLSEARRAPRSPRAASRRLRSSPSGRRARARGRGSAAACRASTSMRRGGPAPVHLRPGAADHDRLAARRTRASAPRPPRRRSTAGRYRVGGSAVIAWLQHPDSTCAPRAPASSAGWRRYGSGHLAAQPRRRKHLAGIAQAARDRTPRARAASARDRPA